MNKWLRTRIERLICWWRGHQWTMYIEDDGKFSRRCSHCKKFELDQTGTNFWKRL